MQTMLDNVSAAARESDLESVNKRKRMSFHFTNNKLIVFASIYINFCQLPVKEVSDFKYLGSTLILNHASQRRKTKDEKDEIRITVARNSSFHLTKRL